jgi:hypothetical protein
MVKGHLSVEDRSFAVHLTPVLWLQAAGLGSLWDPPESEGPVNRGSGYEPSVRGETH